MEKCFHCGADIEPGQKICLKCGCKSKRDITLNITRRSGFNGCASNLIIVIADHDYMQKVTLANGERTSITLPEGDYSFDLTLGALHNQYNISLSKNTQYEVFVMGFWKVKLTMQEL